MTSCGMMQKFGYMSNSNGDNVTHFSHTEIHRIDSLLIVSHIQLIKQLRKYFILHVFS